MRFLPFYLSRNAYIEADASIEGNDEDTEVCLVFYLTAANTAGDSNRHISTLQHEIILPFYGIVWRNLQIFQRSNRPELMDLR